MSVFTIGYEGLGIDVFKALLAERGIETVVDIREVPWSRKPGFSKQPLEGALRLAGIGYVHMVALGCPKPVRDRYRADNNWARYTEGFLAHLKTQKKSIDALAGLVLKSRCALLCFEADPNFCHRSLVANAVRDVCAADVDHIKAQPRPGGPGGRRSDMASARSR